jgi:hypothetical protein
MSDLELKNIELYKEHYLFEHDRRNFYDRLIQYPTTLLVIFIGSSFYSLNKFLESGSLHLCSNSDWIFISTFGLFSLSTIITIYFLGIMFHGSTREYKYLPFTGELEKHEKSLYKYYYKYSEKKTFEERRAEAKKLTCVKFSQDLKKYYIKDAEINQRINDKRADSYYLTRTFLFIDLILLIILSTIGYLF